MREFSHKVALITGAGSGLGREIAQAFATLGAIVAANDLNPVGLDETVGAIRDNGGEARAYVFDIAKRMPVEGMVAQVLDQLGHIDYLVNCASVKPDASLLEMDEWDFHRTLDVNLGGPFFTIQQVGRVMQQQGGGAIVNIISAAPQAVFHKGHSAYSASQMALLELTRVAAHELVDFNIRVNAVCYGQPDILQDTSSGWDFEGFTRWLATHPELHMGDHHHLVSRVAYLCSAAASLVTGQVIGYSPDEKNYT